MLIIKMKSYILIIIFITETYSIIQPHTTQIKQHYFGRNETALISIEKNVNFFALQAMMTNFLDQLTILNNHVNLGLLNEHITELKNQMKSSQLNETIAEQYRQSIMKLLETNQIIQSWEHFRSHIIVDYDPLVKQYLRVQFTDFRKMMYAIKDRRRFIEVVNLLTKLNARKFDIIAILMYWYDAATLYGNNFVAVAPLKKALFDRLVLEKPHWKYFFTDSN